MKQLTTLNLILFLTFFTSLSLSGQNCDLFRATFCTEINNTTVGKTSSVARYAYGSRCYNQNSPAINTFDGPDVTYFFDVTCPSTITIDLYNLNQDLDIFLFEGVCPLSNNNPTIVTYIADLDPCVVSSTNGGTTPDRITVFLQPARYYVIVDGYASHIASSFSLKVKGNCGQNCTFDCNKSISLPCNQTIGGNNITSGNDIDASYYTACLSNSTSSFAGNDVVYNFELDCIGENEVRILLAGLSADLDILLFNGCPSANNVECIDSKTGSGNSNEYLVTDLSQGEYYIVIDGYNTSQLSPFTINVSGKCESVSQNCSACMQPSNDLPTGNVLKCENFDTKNIGDISPQSCDWVEWDNTLPDATVINNPIGSGKVLEIDSDGDVLYLLDRKTSSRYRMSWDMYMAPNKGGYYNIQHDYGGQGTQNWAAHVYLDPNGTATLEIPGITQTIPFEYYVESWNSIMHIFDMDTDMAELWVNNRFIHSWDFTNGSSGSFSNRLGSINFFDANNRFDSHYYVDNICFWRKTCSGSVFTSSSGGSNQLCVANGNSYFNEIDARCDLYTSSEWEVCQSICESEGTFIQTGDRFSEEFTSQEFAPSLLLNEGCITADYGGTLPDSTLAEIFIFYHPDQGDIGFNTFDFEPETQGYLFTCECADVDCETTVQECLGNIQDVGNFVNQPPGFYYLAMISTVQGTFGFNTIPENGICETNVDDIACGDNIVGNLNDEDNNFNIGGAGINPYDNCYSGAQSFDGGDQVYALTLESQQTLDISITADSETGIFLYNFLCGKECFSSRTVPAGGGNVAFNSLTLDKGVYYLILDKANRVGSGEYEMNIDCIDNTDNVIITSFDNTACSQDTTNIHRIDLLKTSNDILKDGPLINFYYPDPVTNQLLPIKDFHREHNGDDVVAFPIPSDFTGDADKCSYTINDPITIGIGDRNSSSSAAFYQAEFLDVGTNGANSDDGLFAIGGVSVISNLSKTKIFSFKLSNNLLEGNAERKVYDNITIAPTFKWSFEVPSPYDTWISMIVKGPAPDQDSRYTVGARTLEVTLEENTSFVERRGTIIFKGEEEIAMRAPINVVQRGSCNFPNVNIVPSSVAICEGEEVTLSINGISADIMSAFDLQWSDNSTGMSISDRPTTNQSYSLTITNKNCGTTMALNQNIVVNTAPNAPVKSKDEVMCEGDAFPTLSVTAEPGDTVNWYESESSTQILWTGINYTPNMAGDFFAEAVKNQTGCNKSPREKVVLTQIQKPTASITNNSVEEICVGTTLQLNGSVGGSANQMVWSTTAGSFNNNTIPNPIFTPPPGPINGIIITLQANSATSVCTPQTETISVNVINTPSISAASNTNLSYCSNEQPPELIVNVGNTANTTVNWYNSASSVSALNGGANTTIFRPNGPGNYFAEATSNTASCVNPTRIQFVVAQKQLPTVDAGNYNAVCEGTPVNLQGIVTGTNVGVMWSSAGNLGNILNANQPNATLIPPSGNSSLSLTLTVNDLEGICSSVTDIATISVSQQPTATIFTPDSEICAGESIQLQGQLSGTNSGVWFLSNSLGTISSPTQINNAQFNSQMGISGNVKAYLTTSSMGICPDKRDSISITIQQNVVVDAGNPQTVCAGDPIQLNGSITGATNQGSWSAPGLGGFFDPPGGNQLNAQYFPPAGVVSVLLKLESIDPIGPCPDESDEVLFQIQESPEITPLDTTCSTDLSTYSFSFAAPSGVNINPSHGNLQASGNNWIITNVPSNVTLMVSVSDQTNCSSEFEITNPNCNCIEILSPADNSFEFCEGDAIPPLRVNNISGNNYTANWYQNGVEVASNTLEFVPSGPGVFFVEFFDFETECVSVDRGRITLVELPLPAVELGQEIDVCPYTIVEVEAQGANNLSYVWNDGTTGKIITVRPEPEEIINLTITVNDGKCENTDAVIVRGFDDVIANIIVTEEIECNGDTNGELQTQITSGFAFFQYLWDNGVVEKELIGVPAGEYSVIVTDFNECSDTASIVLTEPDPITISTPVITAHTDSQLGSISIDVAGGTAPYFYKWESNGVVKSIDEDPIDLEMGFYFLIITDSNGCEFRSQGFEVKRISSTNSTFLSNAISVFPNPTNGELFVISDLPDNLELKFQLLDPLGKLMPVPIKTLVSSEMIHLEIRNQASGIYFLRIMSSEGETVKRIIIE